MVLWISEQSQLIWISKKLFVEPKLNFHHLGMVFLKKKNFLEQSSEI